MAFLTEDELRVVKSEGLQTFTGITNLLQWGMNKAMEKPFYVVGVLALFSIAAGKFKFKLSDVLEVKK